MPETRNLSITQESPINSQHPAVRPLVFEVPNDRTEDGVVNISTAFAHDERIRRTYENASENIWRAKVNDFNGREAMLLKFDEIDSTFIDHEAPIELNIEVYDYAIVIPAVKAEIAELFQRAEEKEAILETESARIDAEKAKRITSSIVFLLLR